MFTMRRTCVRVTAGLIAAISLALSTVPACAVEAQDPAGYERLLVPIFLKFDRAGALGSVWRSSLEIRNEANEPAQIFEYPCIYFCTCVGGTCSGGTATPPHATFTQQSLLDTDGGDGLVLFLQKRLSSDIKFSLRVSDVSRERISLGTDIPVVREQEFSTRPLHIINIPIVDGYRRDLRIYTLDAAGGVFRILLFANEEGQPRVDRTVSTSPFPRTHGEVRISVDYPELAGTSSVRLEIQPVNAPAFWAFVSITNNQSQQVTIGVPR